jgi:tRNA(adenine34) deaminase
VTACTSRRATAAVVALCLVLPAVAHAGLGSGTLKSTAARARAMESADFVPSPSGERDRIFSLLAYATAYRDWQGIKFYTRGYNIAAILVDRRNNPVFWARNAVAATGNSTAHAEKRAIDCYLAASKRNSLEGYTLYTTLEPGIMCAGVMYLTKLARTVYGQEDPTFGGAIERIAMDSSSLPGGYPPYPRKVASDGSTLYHRYWLELLYKAYRKRDPYFRISEFLQSREAKAVFEDAEQALLEYRVIFPENEAVLEQVLAFYREIPAGYVQLCPSQ